MSKQQLSLSKLVGELSELQKDRIAFARALDVIRERLRESINNPRDYPPLYKWSGTRAVVGSLEMAVQHIERNIEEYSEAIRLIEDGVIENADDDSAPKLGVIQGGDHEQ